MIPTLFEFQTEEKIRNKEKAKREAEEERRRKEIEAKIKEEKDKIEEALERKKQMEEGFISTLGLIEQGTNTIEQLVGEHDDNTKNLEAFLKGRKELPQDKIDTLGNHLMDIIENNELKGQDSDESIQNTCKMLI